jgi:hypothetical protein
VDPGLREGKLIKIIIKIFENSKRYYIDFLVSYQTFNSSLDVLSKTFLKNNPDLK